VSVSIVNGYVCYSSCDAAKASTGQNPHPTSDTKNQSSATTAPTAGGVQNPAVVFGGALADRNGAAPAGTSTQAAATNGNSSSSAVDLYA
jgi:hypothetical protein